MLSSKNLFVILITINICLLTKHYSCLDCVINSKEYPFEFLYNSNTGNSLKNPLKLNIFTKPISQIENYDTIKWILIQYGNGTSYLKNKNSDEYLCANNSFFGSKNNRQILTTDKSKKYECLWNIELAESFKKSYLEEEKNYFLWNVKYNRKIYAPSFLFKYNRFHRNVFLWHKSGSSSDEFKWNIECSNGKLMTK